MRSNQELAKTRCELLQCLKLLQERLAAPIPSGVTNTKQISSSYVHRDNGTWVYPPILYASAGGACGGIVCSHYGGGSGMSPSFFFFM